MNTKTAVMATFQDVFDRSTRRSATETPANARIGVVSERKSTAAIASTNPPQDRQPASDTRATQPRTGKSRTTGIRVSDIRSPMTIPRSENSHSDASPPRVVAAIGVDSGLTHSLTCCVNSTSVTDNSRIAAKVR